MKHDGHIYCDKCSKDTFVVHYTCPTCKRDLCSFCSSASNSEAKIPEDMGSSTIQTLGGSEPHCPYCEGKCEPVCDDDGAAQAKLSLNEASSDSQKQVIAKLLQRLFKTVRDVEQKRSIIIFFLYFAIPVAALLVLLLAASLAWWLGVGVIILVFLVELLVLGFLKYVLWQMKQAMHIRRVAQKFEEQIPTGSQERDLAVRMLKSEVDIALSNYPKGISDDYFRFGDFMRVLAKRKVISEKLRDTIINRITKRMMDTLSVNVFRMK